VDSTVEYVRYWLLGGWYSTVFGSDGTFATTAIPESATVGLLVLGFGVVLRRRRR
jgi:hypothetical protein